MNFETIILREKRLRKLAKEAVDAGNCPNRTKRAMDIIRRGDLELQRIKYKSTVHGCECKDHTYGRTKNCKHVIAEIMQYFIETRYGEEE